MEFLERTNSIIKVIGVGGGGSNAVAYMYKQGIHGVDFAICNTDIQALEANPVPIKIQLGPALTEGMGAGSVPEMGKQSCIESIDEVRTFLDSGTKMLFITAGMGGGTGTGAAPIIAKAAKEMGILTVGIVTLPFRFEGSRRLDQALEGLETLKSCVDSVLVISNDRLREMCGDLTLTDAFSKADDILTTAARGIAEIITIPGYINVDFKDVNTVMKNSGVSIMGYAEASGTDRASVAIEAALNSPLLEENDIRGAKHILLNITSGKSEVTMDEIGEITNYIQEEAGYGTHLIWGNNCDQKLGDNISITIIATGFGTNQERKQKEIQQPKKVALDEEVFDLKNEMDQMKPNQPNVIEFDTTINKNEPFIQEAAQKVNRPSMTERRRKEKLEEPSISTTSVPLDSPQIISELESVPAFKRRKVSLDDVDEVEEQTYSKLSINIDENDEPVIGRNNSFFHDNVD